MLCPTDYWKQEAIKKRAYEQRVREVEHSWFTPLVLSATGGLAAEATTFFKRFAARLADKWEQPYSKTMAWLRCCLTFSLLRSVIQCIRAAVDMYPYPLLTSPWTWQYPSSSWTNNHANLLIFTVYLNILYISFSSMYTALCHCFYYYFHTCEKKKKKTASETSHITSEKYAKLNFLGERNKVRADERQTGRDWI